MSGPPWPWAEDVGRGNPGHSWRGDVALRPGLALAGVRGGGGLETDPGIILGLDSRPQEDLCGTEAHASLRGRPGQALTSSLQVQLELN